MASELFVDNITGKTGTSGGAPITLSGDNATITNTTISTGVTGGYILIESGTSGTSTDLTDFTAGTSSISDTFQNYRLVINGLIVDTDTTIHMRFGYLSGTTQTDGTSNNYYTAFTTTRTTADTVDGFRSNPADKARITQNGPRASSDKPMSLIIDAFGLRSTTLKANATVTTTYCSNASSNYFESTHGFVYYNADEDKQFNAIKIIADDSGAIDAYSYSLFGVG